MYSVYVIQIELALPPFVLDLIVCRACGRQVDVGLLVNERMELTSRNHMFASLEQFVASVQHCQTSALAAPASSVVLANCKRRVQTNRSFQKLHKSKQQLSGK